MPPEAYCTREEAAAMLDRDAREILVVSHGWQCAHRPPTLPLRSRLSLFAHQTQAVEPQLAL